MALLGNLLVNGVSRFLNTIYCQDIQVSGTATFSSISASGNITAGGNLYSTTGNLYLKNLLAINGQTDSWLRINANNAFSAGTFFGTNIVRTDGTFQVGANGAAVNIYYQNGNSNKAMTVSIPATFNGTTTTISNLVATTGNIATLNSTNLSVSNNLHAAHFDLQTVAQLGGSFYVSPTVKFPNSGTSLTVEKSGTTLTLTITDSSITSTTMAGIVWSANSRVKVSGTINGVVTGTMDGTISSINTGSHTLTLSVSGENSGSVQASPSGSPYTASQFSDLSVMVYQRRDGSNDYRVGIWMNCYDIANSSSTIRIYGGSDANPNVMLGNLTSAGLGTVNNLTPTGWGLFAQNAFLHGKVVANGGLIGNWTIGESSMYYSSDTPSNSSIVLAPGGKTASVNIGGSGTAQKSWVFTVKNLFGIDTSGALYSSSGKIGGWNIGTSSLYNTTNSMTSTGVGLYLGTDGIRNYASGTQYVNITSGKITALGVDVSGKITATSGAIGGFDITATAIKTKDVAVTSNADNSISLSSADFTRTINSTSRAGLRFAIGDKFGVTGDGTIYAGSANISGNSKIGPWNVTDTSIYKVSNTLGSDTSGAAYFGNLGLSVGNKFIVDANGVATLGLSSGYHATMDTDSFDVLNGSTTLATFGETAVIGNMSARGVSIDTNGFKFNNNGEQNFFIGIDNRQAETITSGNATVTNSSTHKSIDGLTYYRVASIPSGGTVASVVGHFSYAVENGEEVLFAAVDDNVSHWTVDSGYLWVEDGYSSYSQFEETIKYSYTTQANSNLPYMVLGTSAYEDDIIAGVNSFAQGYKNKALGSFSTALGSSTVASGTSSFACGVSTKASGQSSFACGVNAVASGRMSFACGKGTVASGVISHAEGVDTTASGAQSHAEGASTTASSISSHAEGINTTASGNYSHAEGYNTTASNTSSHSEGFITTASGEYSHTEGCYTIASGMGSHAGGGHTVATQRYNTVIGMYNKATVSGTSPNYTYSDTGDYPFIIGNGTADTTARRSNAFTVDWSGNVWAAGKVMAANTSHIGMIIMSTTLNTMAKVIAQYGGTTWIQHSGYFLYGASSGVTANHAAADGGEATHTLTINEMPSHGHRVFSYYAYNAGQWDGLIYQSMYNEYRDHANGNANFVENTGGGQAHNNMPPFKQVYIWERTA